MDNRPGDSSLVVKKAAKTVTRTGINPGEKAVVARLISVNHQYGARHALRDISLDLPAGCMVGLIGPDGVGKSTLLGLVAGARQLQQGRLEVLGGNMADSHFRSQVAPCIAYMPQGLGGNLYHTLTVDENIDFFADLFGLRGKARGEQIDRLLDATGLLEFRSRPAGKLSGGMKQKLGLCCALIHNPDLLILDEPTTGVDPLSRKRFWDLIDTIRSQQAGMSVLVATAYMEEAERYDWLVAMDNGAILATGSPQELKQQTETDNLDDAFIALLPKDRQETGGDAATTASASAATDNADVPAIEAHNLTLRFGDFTAVKDVSFTIPKGEIFGFLGSNGCGKTTTMKMLTGLLTPSEGEVLLFGATLDARDLKTRQRVGYMSQSFSLYNELTVRQNLELHAKLFHLPAERIQPRMDELTQEFSLEDVMDRFAGDLPLGVRQRLSLAVAVVHSPELLILDEPTSGVDPGARNRFWQLLLRLSREDGVTIFISTHFMNEGERCDRISLMHAGEVLACDTPAALAEQAGVDNLEAAFMQTLEAVDKEPVTSNSGNVLGENASDRPRYRRFSFQRLMAYGRRETRELLRDPIRMSFAFIGSALLMLILGYGITLDVEDLTFAVLDQDQTPQSRDYITAVSGSRYFLEQPPVATIAELEERMKSGELSLVLAIPPGFGKNLKRGRPTEIAVWVDGAMPFRGETILGYMLGLHFSYLKDLAQRTYGSVPAFSLVTVEARYRYNQDFRSLDAMVPAVIPILLIFIPAILMALGIVREKELGSITNLYVTPVTRLEFLLGKQLPYIGFSMVSYVSLVLLAIFLFDVPIKGGVLTLTFGALLFVTATTGLGQVISAFASTQIAALAATAIITILPTVQFSGMTEPVSSLDGAAAVIGQFWPATWFLQISRGVFTKGLTLGDMQHAFLVLAAFIPVLTLMVYTAGSAGSMELHNAPVAVVDEDQSALAGHMIDSLQPPWFMPPDQIQYGQIDEVLDKGSHTFVLVIPDGFERDIRQGRVTSVQLNIDATRMTQAFIGSRYIEQLLTTEVAEFMQTGSAGGALPINLVTRVSFNPNLDGTWFGGVMELTNMITMISIILTGAALIREREHGTVEHLMVMPIKPFEIMAAKVWANGLVVMLAATLSVTLVIQLILKVPVQGSIMLFMFGTLIHLFSTTAIGILIGTVARTMPQFGLLLILTILPLQMLSGGITPRESMPDLVQNIMLVAPTTHFVSLAQAILYRGAGLEVVWPQMLALVAIGMVFFSVALALFRRHLAV